MEKKYAYLTFLNLPKYNTHFPLHGFTMKQANSLFN